MKVAALCCGKGTSALQKDGINGIMKYKDYLDILKQILRTSARKLKLAHVLVFQENNDPNHISKDVTKWLKDKKVKGLTWPTQTFVL